MGGKVSAEYYRKWRASHPGYRKREVERTRRRRAERGREDRTEEYRRRREKRLQENADHGGLLESSLIRKAKELALRIKQPDRRTHVYDDCYEELVSVCVLALCEGSDPGAAMKAFMADRATRTRLLAQMGGWDE